MKKISIVALVLLFASFASAQDNIRYRRIELDDASCDVGILYTARPGGVDIAVSAIATGRGAEFRKWEVTDIRLRIAGGKLRPSAEGKFFVNKESFFRVPSAVVFAVLGSQIPAYGSGLNKGITRTGAAIGLGVLAFTAKGDIAGQKCVFDIDDKLAGAIDPATDAVEITIADNGIHRRHTVEVRLDRPSEPSAAAPDFGAMNQDELRNTINALAMEAGILRKEQSACKRGADPRYDELQRKIDDIEARRGLAYKLWYDREGAAAGRDGHGMIGP
jgi:hypothetical protein